MKKKKIARAAKSEDVLETVVIEEEPAVEAEAHPEELPRTPEENKAIKQRLMGELEALREKEQLLAKKISIAKERGLHEPADRCRLLLQRVVVYRKNCEEELARVEELIRRDELAIFRERFNREVDALQETIESEMLGFDIHIEEPDYEPFVEQENRYRGRAKRLSVCSIAFLWIGLFGSLVGNSVYFLLVQLEKIDFSWLGIYAFGFLLAGFLLIALLFGVASNYNKKKARRRAEEIAEQRARYEADCAERDRRLEELRFLTVAERADAVAEAYSIERAGDERQDTKRAIQALIPDLSDTEAVKKHAKRAAVLTVITTAAVVLLMKGRKKKKATHEREV